MLKLLEIIFEGIESGGISFEKDGFDLVIKSTKNTEIIVKDHFNGGAVERLETSDGRGFDLGGAVVNGAVVTVASAAISSFSSKEIYHDLQDFDNDTQDSLS